jgi:type III pantothenate kinase
MTRTPASSLIAVDVGNTRIKLGEFALPLSGDLPLPVRTGAFGAEWTDAGLDGWLDGDANGYTWAISSVNRPSSDRLLAWLAERGARRVRVLGHRDLPVAVEVQVPEEVGLDRLVDVVAANRLRAAGEPAIVIDHGSAITVNLISAAGAFVGGAILPGVRLAARALHDFTDKLPYVDVREVPTGRGTDTEGSISFGLYWGAVGAAREVVARLTPESPHAAIFVTGGGGADLAALLAESGERPTLYVQHLTLSGIACSAALLAAKEAT